MFHVVFLLLQTIPDQVNCFRLVFLEAVSYVMNCVIRKHTHSIFSSKVVSVHWNQQNTGILFVLIH